MIQQKVRKKKSPVFNAQFQYSQSKMTRLKKIWSKLAMLKCESRTSLHLVQYK